MSKLAKNPPREVERSAEAPLIKGPVPDSRELSLQEAQLLRSQLASFVEDWEAPGMEAYDKL